MAIHHQETDRLPRGELLVEETFLNRYYPGKADTPYLEKMKQFVEEIGLDIVTVKIISGELEKGLKELKTWAMETSYFVLALIDGLFWKPEDPLSFQEFLLGIVREEGRIQNLIHLKKNRALQLIKICLDEGAHGCIIGDDLAYHHAPFLSPEKLREWILPGFREIVEAVKREKGIAFLHSCGNLTNIIDLILSADFDGIHGLAPSAGNDPIAIRKRTLNRVALMGIFEVDHINPQEIKNMKEKVLPVLSSQGGYIFGSAEGLSRNTPFESFRALYINREKLLN